MTLSLDTENVQEIQEVATLGIPDGVTTNLSRAAKEGRVFRDALMEISNIVDGPISTETINLEAAAMVKERERERGTRQDPSEHCRQDNPDLRGTQDDNTAGGGKNQRQRDAVLLIDTNVVGCERWCLGCASVHRPVRRHSSDCEDQ